MCEKIRILRTDEIECRVQQVTQSGVILLLYKDARCDMSILDEVYTPFGWQRSHEFINGKEYCTVSIFDTEKKQWISKADCGTESNTEKEKGQASDAFKRACVNWGIGRELYTRIFIFIQCPTVKNGNRYEMKNKFEKYHVSSIKTDAKAKKILQVEIADSSNNVVFKWDNKNPPKTESPQLDEPKEYRCCDCNKEFEDFTGKDGKSYTGGQAYHIAERYSDDSKARCQACRKKYREAKKNEQSNSNGAVGA